MGENREEIEITPDTRGTIVFAKSTHMGFTDWILLIKNVEEIYEPNPDMMIYTHVSWNVTTKEIHANVDANHKWGLVKQYGFKFHKATEEDKNTIKQILKVHNKKYVRGVNKLFDR